MFLRETFVTQKSRCSYYSVKAGEYAMFGFHGLEQKTQTGDEQTVRVGCIV